MQARNRAVPGDGDVQSAATQLLRKLSCDSALYINRQLTRPSSKLIKYHNASSAGRALQCRKPCSAERAAARPSAELQQGQVPCLCPKLPGRCCRTLAGLISTYALAWGQRSLRSRSARSDDAPPTPRTAAKSTRSLKVLSLTMAFTSCHAPYCCAAPGSPCWVAASADDAGLKANFTVPASHEASLRPAGLAERWLASGSPACEACACLLWAASPSGGIAQQAALPPAPTPRRQLAAMTKALLWRIRRPLVYLQRLDMPDSGDVHWHQRPCDSCTWQPLATITSAKFADYSSRQCVLGVALRQQCHQRNRHGSNCDRTKLDH